ncbi:MAG TPA: hypothetical protein VNI84_20140 [Pyrinomonadaceae bacterium]|nr:hypothetical protein [Pyrinomonadaceae bacterium]
MNTGRNNTRRNRNIGTARQGHGQNNKFEIPSHFSYREPKVYFEDLKNYRNVERIIKGYSITFLVEETRDECVHACTVDDITYVLQNIPAADLEDLPLIILRQPKRKEEILNPVWGRYIYYAVIDEHDGSAICLDTFDLSKPVRWSKSLSPDSQNELERLKADGHSIETTKRHHIVSSNLASVRATQLYRTLLHELGHHVDRMKNEDAFETKTSKDKEMFAHRYADEMREYLKQKGILPFERIFDLRSIESDKLRAIDFVALQTSGDKFCNTN